MTKEKTEKKAKKSPLEQKIQNLEERYSEQEKKLEEAQNAQMRALADLQNFQRRESENKINWSRDSICIFLEKLIPRFRELEMSQIHTEDKNVQKTIKNFFMTLEKIGFEKINPKPGTAINTEENEVLLTAEGESGCIVQVLESGWKFQDKVITPAKVSAAQE